MANISTKYTTKNRTYSNPSIIDVYGFVLHSVGVGASLGAEGWQKRFDSVTRSNSVHAVCDENEVIIMLPCLEEKGKSYKCWGCGTGSKGLSGNTHRIQIEQDEIKGIVYTSGSNFKLDGVSKERAQEFVYNTMNQAADFFAECCLFHGLDPLGTAPDGNGVIETHYSLSKKGYASSHGDCDHLWRGLDMDYTLDDFRNLVNDKLQQLKLEEEIKNMTDEQFAEYMNRYLANLRNKPADTWAEGYLSWAKENGIMAGNDSGNLMPQSFLTRQEMATMLNAFYNKFI